MARDQLDSNLCVIMRLKCYEYLTLFDKDNDKQIEGGRREDDVGKCDRWDLKTNNSVV